MGGFHQDFETATCLRGLSFLWLPCPLLIARLGVVQGVTVIARIAWWIGPKQG